MFECPRITCYSFCNVYPFTSVSFCPGMQSVSTELNKAKPLWSLSIAILASIGWISYFYRQLWQCWCRWSTVFNAFKSLRASHAFALCPVSTMAACATEPWSKGGFDCPHLLKFSTGEMLSWPLSHWERLDEAPREYDLYIQRKSCCLLFLLPLCLRKKSCTVFWKLLKLGCLN